MWKSKSLNFRIEQDDDHVETGEMKNILEWKAMM